MATVLSSFRAARGLKFSVSSAERAISLAFDEKARDIAKANTEGMRDVEKLAKNSARDAVRAGGPMFRKRWPNAVRSQTYPKRGKAMGPAALIWIRSDYAGIFETGGTIGGSPYLWLPLPGVPPYLRQGGRLKRIRPGLLRGLISIRRPGKTPMLGIRVKATEARLRGPITTSLLMRGTYEGMARKRGQKIKFRVIPLFVGVKASSLKKRWNVRQAVERAGLTLNSKILSRLRG